MQMYYDSFEDFLWQAIPQFELFCNYRAPKDAMDEVICISKKI